MQVSQKSLNIDPIKLNNPIKSENKDKVLSNPLILQTNNETSSISSIKGKASSNISFLSIEKNNDSVLGFKGIKAGDKFEIDGPVWYDGKATVKKSNATTLEFDISMKADKKIMGFDTKLPYVTKDGKINISLEFVKNEKNNTIRLTTTDKNNSNKTFSNNFDYNKSSKSSTITTKEGFSIVFTQTDGNISIKPAKVPFSINLKKS